MRISGLAGKLLSSVLSASMVIAFAPAVASAAVTSNDGQEGGDWNDDNAVNEGYYFKTVDANNVATYYKPGEVKDAPEGSTLELIGNYAARTTDDIVTLPANATLDMGVYDINAIDQVTGAVVNLSGDAQINASDEGSYIASLSGTNTSTVTVSGSFETRSCISVSSVTLSNNASLTTQGVDGSVKMGKDSSLNIYLNGRDQQTDIVGINGNLVMGNDAENAAAKIYLESSKSVVGIRNADPITVHSGQTLEVRTWGQPDSAENVAISGNLSVESGANVDIEALVHKSDNSVGFSTAVGGSLQAATGSYAGKIEGSSNKITGGSFRLDPADLLEGDYGIKHIRGDYVVVPKSELSDKITNLYWGKAKDIDNDDSPAYTINFTSSKNSIGEYRFEFLKETAGEFKKVFSHHWFYNEGGVSQISNEYAFHQLLGEVGSDNISGTYKFSVTEIYYDEDGYEEDGATAVSEAYSFTKPSKALGSVTNLRWNKDKPTTACFTLPEGASGYSVTLYKQKSDGSYRQAGGMSLLQYGNNSSRNVEENLSGSMHQMLTELGVYKFAVRAYSSDLEKILDGPESEMSPEFNLGDVTKKVTEGVSTSANNGKDFLSKEDPSVVGAAMTGDASARKVIEDAEAAYKQANNVATTAVSTIDQIDTDKVSAIGAAYNAESGTSVELKIGQASQKRIDNDSSLKSAIEFSMDLVQKGATSSEDKHLGTDGKALDVPVCVTIPVPDSMKGNLRIHHYTSSGSSYETIWPVVFTGEDGQTYARFYVTHFSDFVLLVEEEGGSTEEPGTGGSSGSGGTGGSGSGGGSTIVTPPSTDPSTPGTDEPSKPNEPTTPDTPAADGPEVGTVATVSGITYKVTAAGEVEVSKLPAGKKTVTIPAKVKVGGKSCAVTGIASGLLKGSKATTLVIKSKDLTKKSIKNALKSSKVKVVKIKVSGKKSVNKKYVKQYKKIFTKKICGKKVTVK